MAHVRCLVRDAIRRQLVSDVPIGTFLSGGLDSSVISAVAAETLGERGERLRTFSVDYRENDRYFTAGKFQPSADGPYIEAMADCLDTLHTNVVLDPVQVAAALDDAAEARDLPGMADVDSSLLLFCRGGARGCDGWPSPESAPTRFSEAIPGSGTRRSGRRTDSPGRSPRLGGRLS